MIVLMQLLTKQLLIIDAQKWEMEKQAQWKNDTKILRYI